MKFSVFFLMALSLFSTMNTQAQTLSETEIMPPFLRANCAPNQGQLGQIGLRLEKLTVTETADQLNVSVTSSLSVCAVDTNKNFSWLDVNPYVGFQVQYYDDASGSIQSRKVFIDPAKPYNRMKLLTLNNPESLNGTSAEATMKPNTGNSFSGEVLLNKSDIVDEKDLAKLNRGEIVKKTIAVYQISNFTTELNGEDLLLGDEDRGGRNIVLSFKKTGSTIVLDQISLK